MGARTNFYECQFFQALGCVASVEDEVALNCFLDHVGPRMDTSTKMAALQGLSKVASGDNHHVLAALHQVLQEPGSCHQVQIRRAAQSAIASLRGKARKSV